MLGTAEVISDEYIDPVVGNRHDQNLPPTAYKVPRSKIVAGPYGSDGGDVTADNPLTVESRAERQALELQSLRDRAMTSALFVKLSSETVPICDARGWEMSTRGVR